MRYKRLKVRTHWHTTTQHTDNTVWWTSKQVGGMIAIFSRWYFYLFSNHLLCQGWGFLFSSSMCQLQENIVGTYVILLLKRNTGLLKIVFINQENRRNHQCSRVEPPVQPGWTTSAADKKIFICLNFWLKVMFNGKIWPQYMDATKLQCLISMLPCALSHAWSF